MFKSLTRRLPLYCTLPIRRKQHSKASDPETMLRMMPPKPEPPSNDDCCLSGCEFCVWDLYDEDMKEYQKSASQVQEAFEAHGKPVPDSVKPETIRDAVDPTMRAFLDMEREMAMKIKEEEEDDR